MTFPQLSVNDSAATTEALTQLVGKYRRDGKVDMNDAYVFLANLTIDIERNEGMTQAIAKLAELDVRDVMIACGEFFSNVELTTHNRDIPPQVLAITYYVIANTLTPNPSNSTDA